jgi:hypothetical protein
MSMQKWCSAQKILKADCKSAGTAYIDIYADMAQ